MMKGINQSNKLGLEIITPTQAGSGEELFKELDYIARGNDLLIVDQPQSFNAVATGDQNLDTLLASGSHLSDLVNTAGQDFGYRLPWLSGKQKIPEKFREHVKDALNRPYIPGTAIKGAIRTACVSEILRALPNESYERFLPYWDTRHKRPSAKRGNADSKLISELVGKDAKQDLFRAFKVKDALFENDDLRLSDIRWLNENRWRSMSKRRSFNDWQQADGMYAEVLQTNALAVFSMQWDGFLLSDNRWMQKDIISNLLPKDFVSLKEKLNAHARYRLTHEIEFYQKQGKHQPKQECENILAMIADDQEAAYMQLSWGSGWRGMTGDWLQDNQLQSMRELYKLGKTGRDFPKTRRLVVSGEPKYPLGWVRLIPYQLIAEKIEKKMQVQQAKANRSAWVEQKIQHFMQKNRCTEQDALRGKALAFAWQELEEGEIKTNALADIKMRWQEKDWWESPNGKSAKKAKEIYTSGVN